MKKVLATLLATALCAAMLAGCSGSGKPKVTGEMYDTGAFRALVPGGWAAFPITDVFSDEHAADTSCFNIIKDGASDLDLFSKPYVRLDYYGPDTQMMKPSRENYENVEEVAPMQLGTHSWSGFTGEDGYGGRSAILWAEEGDIQYQAVIWLEAGNEKITLDDEDVQAILASVEPSGGSISTDGMSSGSAVPTGNYDWWENHWYGWWAIKNGTGIYQKPSELKLVWDTYAEIDVYNDNTGRVTIWDTGTSMDEPMIIAYDVSFEPGSSDKGRLVSRRVDFFPCGHWNDGMEADTMSEREVGWIIDPAESTVSHFENMLEITGHYASPETPTDSFDYYIYLRPWGTLWDDVRTGNTEGCLYKDMMPPYHDDWYVSLLHLGYERPTATFREGIAIINDYLAKQDSGGGGGTLDPAAKEGADGKVDMATLKTALTWCKENASYNTPYDEIAAQFGVHGKQIDSLFENCTIYRWWATKDAYVQITFSLGADGSELWNVTQYDGIS